MENIPECTNHNYLGNHQIENGRTKGNDHKYDQPAKNNIYQNLTENAQDQQANNTQNDEAIIMLPTGAVRRIIVKKETKFDIYKQRIMYPSQQTNKMKITKN